MVTQCTVKDGDKRSLYHRRVTPVVNNLFAGSYEDRRRFGVKDTLATLGVLVCSMSVSVPYCMLPWYQLSCVRCSLDMHD